MTVVKGFNPEFIDALDKEGVDVGVFDMIVEVLKRLPNPVSLDDFLDEVDNDPGVCAIVTALVEANAYTTFEQNGIDYYQRTDIFDAVIDRVREQLKEQWS